MKRQKMRKTKKQMMKQTKKQKAGQEKIEERLKSILNMLNILMIISAVFSLIAFQIIGNKMTSFYHTQYANTKKQMEIRKDIQTISKRALLVIVEEDGRAKAEIQKVDFKERFEKIDGYINGIGKNLKDKKAKDDLSKTWKHFEEGTNYMIDMVLEGNHKDAKTYYETTYNSVSETLTDVLDVVEAESEKVAAGEYNVSEITRVAASALLLLIAFLSIYRASKHGKKLIKSIVEPLKEINIASQEIAEGNLHVQILYTSEDEIGQVAESLRNSIQKIASYIDDIDDVMEKMAEGNFAIALQNEFIGDFKNIENSLSDFTKKISKSMREVEQVAEQLFAGSAQIARAAQNLAEGATDQAGIVEELSATVNDVTQRITDNAQNAGEISKEVGLVTGSIIEENERMQNVVKAMETINETSNEISKIIDTINDIASQTNLLALNASIEAARAGEAGRGFAVVADQVSALASQSAEAAKTSTKYIEQSLMAVEHGKVIAGEAAKALDAVADSASAITDKVDGIAVASSEQSEAVQQINGGIEQIANVVETNAATAEESSASSEELAGQSNKLKELLMNFKLKQV